ncbi:cobyric acid synthase [Candidatus Nitrosocosmicus sp. SS]|uniref:cobyric acid synthase n=1 Tax=Candidatus Nitrosocosmicus agrestis TaxID=2563600 RepID=UPI0019176376|nr:cobyric acid synthase [Candidatus Nitrosocosmicus sp. SS]MDR4491831.1 cobyric acid synthase [Candidatus Nitrosocosmicus sp.]
MKSKILMIQGTTSGAGKSLIVTALCRILSNLGYKVAPFKSQNMSSLLHVIDKSNRVIAKAQAIQAVASRVKPTPDMNPILLKPVGNYESRVYVKGNYFDTMSAQQYYSEFVLTKGFQIAIDSFKTLQKEHEVILLEGAGSPAEINIQEYDIANMLFANKVKAPVILVSDIERGGCFASILGTIMLLEPKHQKLIKGIIINKFLGDNKILSSAIQKIQNKTKKPVLGVVPKIEHAIPEEDSLDSNKKQRNRVKQLQLHRQDTESNERVKEKQKPRKDNLITRKKQFQTENNTYPSNAKTNIAPYQIFADQEILEDEIQKFANILESSINLEHILDKILK